MLMRDHTAFTFHKIFNKSVRNLKQDELHEEHLLHMKNETKLLYGYIPTTFFRIFRLLCR